MIMMSCESDDDTSNEVTSFSHHFHCVLQLDAIHDFLNPQK
jgi:hypothetical protein